MSGLLTKVLRLPVQFPLVRGMLSYAIIWPSCSIVQEYLEHGTRLSNANWARAARFSFFGTFFMAPVFYGWMKYSSRFFKRKDLITAISRAAVEQVSYSPLAMAYFFFGMSMLEGKPYKVCVNEVREKFWPTYKIGMVFWPTAQTLNFYFVSEKNRIVFVSAASFVWTVYLAHMKGKEQKNESRFSGLDEQSFNIEPMAANLDTGVEVESTMDKFIAGDSGGPDLITDQNPVKEMKGDADNVSESPVVVVDNTAEEKKPELVSDEHPDGKTSLVVESLSDSDETEGSTLDDESEEETEGTVT
ncbi:mpv17-like protein [Ostrinia nubilalis]|uniref:mpv17-like protein n=1 Tax=Ostrinia nubilalis TaxID=29057 RepID=UPI0030824BE1